MNKAYLIILALVIFSSYASAIQHFQIREFSDTSLGDADNKTIRVRSILVYSTTDGTDSNIKNGNPLETYIQYNTFIDTWNNDNSAFAVESCNLAISKITALANETVVLFNRTFTDDTKDGRFFINIVPREDIVAIMQCKFSGNRPKTLELPADIVTVTPTWECKACQQFEWSQDEVTLSKSKVLSDGTKEIWGLIKSLILLNFEFILILFWILTIIILFIAIGFIFAIGYWIFVKVAKYIK